MMKRRIALVTGANKGIGFETAKQLGNLGYTVIIGARDQEKIDRAVTILQKEGVDVFGVVLDVTEPDSIDKALQFIEKSFGQLDVLINNAGIFLEKDITPTKLNLDILRETFDVNFFGAFATIVASLKLLKKSESGRIVNVSSGQGSLTRNSNTEGGRLQLAYNSSKAALNALTIQFAKELIGTSIKINSAAPGFTITDMNEGKGNKSAAEAARIIVELATLDDNGVSGGFFEDGGIVPW